MYAKLPKVRGWENTTPLFRTATAVVAKNLGIEPAHLFTCMGFESAGSFSPSKRNPLSGATGLIQFMASTAKRLGTSLAALAALSPEEQLGWVQAYFMPWRNKLHTLEDVYLAIFSPAFIGKPNDTIMYRAGQPAYEQNRGFDPHGTGVITKAAVTAAIRTYAGTAKDAWVEVEAPPSTTVLPVVMGIGGMAAAGYVLAQWIQKEPKESVT